MPDGYTNYFVNALRFLAKINKHYRRNHQDFLEIGQIIRSKKTGEMKLDYDEVRKQVLTPVLGEFRAHAGTGV